MMSFDCQLQRADFSLDAAFQSSGGITALFGPSGSGKSTIIRLLAGLEKPKRGRIMLNDHVLLDTERGINLPPHKRRIGLVFQDAQLFPHLSVRANLTYGRWFTKAADRTIGFDPVIDVLGIGALLERKPGSLSGGERQRVGIGRALLTSPQLLLMDEPLASLDTTRKLEILPFIERLRDEFALPIVYVSHAVEEVARLAQTVVKLEAGRVIGIGTPTELLTPTSLANAADRFDAVSFITGKIADYLPQYGVTRVGHPAGEIIVTGKIEPLGGEVRIAVRATNVTLAVGRPGNISMRTALAGKITKLETDSGPFALATLELTGGDTLRVYATRLATDQLGLDVGDDVQALVKSVAIDERGIPGLHLVGQSF